MYFPGRCRPFSPRLRVDVLGDVRGNLSNRASRFKGSAYGIAAEAEALGAARHPNVWKLTPRQMNAFLFIQNKRKSAENIDFVGKIRVAMKGDKQDVEKAMERWAKDAEIRLMFED